MKIEEKIGKIKELLIPTRELSVAEQLVENMCYLIAGYCYTWKNYKCPQLNKNVVHKSIQTLSVDKKLIMDISFNISGEAIFICLELSTAKKEAVATKRWEYSSKLTGILEQFWDYLKTERLILPNKVMLKNAFDAKKKEFNQFLFSGLDKETIKGLRFSGENLVAEEFKANILDSIKPTYVIPLSRFTVSLVDQPSLFPSRFEFNFHIALINLAEHNYYLCREALGSSLQNVDEYPWKIYDFHISSSYYSRDFKVEVDSGYISHRYNTTLPELKERLLILSEDISEIVNYAY